MLAGVRLQAFGQSIGWLVSQGIAPIISDVGGGVLYDVLGGSAVFIAASGLALVGGIIVFLALAGLERGRARAPTPEAAEGEPAPVVIER